MGDDFASPRCSSSCIRASEFSLFILILMVFDYGDFAYVDDHDYYEHHTDPFGIRGRGVGGLNAPFQDLTNIRVSKESSP